MRVIFSAGHDEAGVPGHGTQARADTPQPDGYAAADVCTPLAACGLSSDPRARDYPIRACAPSAPSAIPADAEMYLPLWMSILRSSGAYAADEAAATARTLLPDTCAATGAGWPAAPTRTPSPMTSSGVPPGGR